MRTRIPGFSTLLVVMLVACGGDGTDPVGPPASIESLTTVNLSGVVGEQLTTPLEVRVTDAQGRGVPRVAVTFSVTSGGGHLDPLIVRGVEGQGIAAQVVGVAQPVTDSTDANGEARVMWTLGTVAGGQEVVATVTEVGSVAFSATAEPGPVAGLRIVSGSGQAALAGESPADPFVVAVEDQFRNPIAGETIAWQVLSGGGQLSSATSISDPQGRAAVTATLGSGSVLQQFEAQASAGAPAVLELFALTSIVDDALGDLISETASPPDLLQFGAAVDGDSLLLYVRFSSEQVPVPLEGTIPVNAVFGFLDIDVDQDVATGLPAIQEEAGAADSGAMQMGVDAYIVIVALPNTSVPSFVAVRVDSITPDSAFQTGIAVAQRTRGTVMTVGVPLTFLQDDGNVNITSLVADPVDDSTTLVTDIAPEAGHVVVGPAVIAQLRATTTARAGMAVPLSRSHPRLRVLRR